jgi:HD-like signal output (HDOD) protein
MSIDRTRILRAAASLGGAGADSFPRMLALLCDSRATASEIGSLIEKHPSMYARVLRVANSPYYGQPRAVRSIERALALLGVDALRGIAATTCFDRAAVRSSVDTEFDMLALLRHSLATAAAAEALARISHKVLAAELFIAGLLHNLGTVVQLQIDAPGINAMIAALRTQRGGDLRALESAHVAVGHEECLAVIFEAWQLPELLVAAARYHHDPLSAPEAQRDTAAFVNLGANLGLDCGHTFALEPASVGRHGPAMIRLGLNDAQLDAVAAELPGRVAQLSAALSDA